MAYNLFSRTSKPTIGIKQKDVLGNPHNNASYGINNPRKPDGLLNRIQSQNQYDWPDYDFGGPANYDDFNQHQAPNDYQFYQGYQGSTGMIHGSPLNNYQDTYDAQALGNFDYYINANQWNDNRQQYRGQGLLEFDNFYSPQRGSGQPIQTSQWQPYGNKKEGRRNYKTDLKADNLEFKYRTKADGRVFVDSQIPLIYSKNLIPDISAFSRSEPSFQVIKRKRSISDSDLEAEVSDDMSEDVENHRRLRELNDKCMRRTKSHDDAAFSGLANIKIEGLIQRKLGFKIQEKKGGEPTLTEKFSNGNSASIQIQKTANAIENTAVKKDENSDMKKETKDKFSKQKKRVDKINDNKVEEGVKYNKEELVSTLRDLIKAGGFDQSKVVKFDKYDEELGKAITYVRIDLSHVSNFNDHFISIKPDLGSKPKAEPGKQRDPEADGEMRKNSNHENQGRRHGEPTNNTTNLNFYQQTTLSQHVDFGFNMADGGFEDQQEEHLTVLEQAMHKKMTGKLQRNIRRMNDDEKISMFKQLKGHLHELSTNQYGRYVLVLLLKSNLTAIVDALVSHFDKKIMELIKHKNGLLFSQSLIDLKFKDVRLRRSLKHIDKSLGELMADDHAPHVILIYANQLPASDMEDFVDYCKSEFRICLDNPIACKVFAKVFGKVSDVGRLEIELNLKTIVPQIFDGGIGRELVEMFFTKADQQNLLPLRRTLFENLPKYLTNEDYEYFFTKVAELKKTELIDALLAKCFKDKSMGDDQLTMILNNGTGYKIILSFFTLASMSAKDLMRVKLDDLRKSQAVAFNNLGKKVLTLCDNYFYAPSK